METRPYPRCADTAWISRRPIPHTGTRSTMRCRVQSATISRLRNDTVPNALLAVAQALRPKRTKKTDVARYLTVFRHVGLHFNEPPGIARLPFILSSDKPIFRNGNGRSHFKFHDLPTHHSFNVSSAENIAMHAVKFSSRPRLARLNPARSSWPSA